MSKVFQKIAKFRKKNEKVKFFLIITSEFIFILAASDLVNKKDSEDAEVKTNRLALAKYFKSRDPEKSKNLHKPNPKILWR